MDDLDKHIPPDRLPILLKVSRRLAAERDFDRLLSMILEETTSAMDAERSSLFLTDREKHEMWAKLAQGVGETEIRFPLGAGIAGIVGVMGESINIPDAYCDARFNPEFDRRTGFHTRSILCVPMTDRHGMIIGAVQVLNKKSGVFGADDEALLLALAAQAAVAIENADLYKRLSDINLSLEKKVEERTEELTQANLRLSALNKELLEISIADGLTQVYNRRYLMERLRQEVKRASRYGPAVSLLMIDIDHFKKVNDTFGHQAGDAVLAGVAGLIKWKLRETDLIARYGGEEFCVIATGTEQAGAVLLAERLRQLVAEAVFEHGGNRLMVTVSIGVVAWEPSLKDDYEQLIRRADKALYCAKDQGRNRVCA
jgi:diguanylate cyclase (GGDEF)-like protein